MKPRVLALQNVFRDVHPRHGLEQHPQAERALARVQLNLHAPRCGCTAIAVLGLMAAQPKRSAPAADVAVAASTAVTTAAAVGTIAPLLPHCVIVTTTTTIIIIISSVSTLAGAVMIKPTCMCMC